jgi:type III secretion protein Q
MANAVLPVPYQPAALTPEMAGLCDALCSRAALLDGNSTLQFHFEPVPADWQPAAGFTLDAGGFSWRLEFARMDFLAANETLAGAALDRLPEPICQAAILLVLQPMLDRLETALGIALNPAESAEGASGWLEPPLSFTLDFTAGDERSWRIPVRLRAASGKGASWLRARILDALPEPRKNPARRGWPLVTTLEAGNMRIPLRLLRDMAVGDILLPPQYPAANGVLTLILGKGSGLRLNVSDGRAVVTDFLNNEESGVNDATASPSIDAASLEVLIRFELEKKLLPLAEVEALAPGKTFPLGVDPLSAVTVTLNGQALAAGRLVDLGGVLGVQITRLAGEQDSHA